ncbi:carbonic anhydrase family protein [Candidatus Acetothermia bacterium]|nr:carbonic anhydrase family protein [Candidatus Acetothermia bacterium]MBI3644325.1 carbonic anhydrase family protein [Candidatus Acetothermia bacterium]
MRLLTRLSLWALSLALVSFIALAADWGYEGKTGPDFWGGLSEDFALCAAGKSQSPINIVDSVATRADLKDIEFHYDETALTILNNGHTIEVEYDSGSYIILDGIRFDLVQFHFHAPSEHMLNGHQFPMEMHLVHKSADGELAVIGLLIQEGQENPAFKDILENMPKEASEESHVIARLNADDLLPASRTTYRYSGSLTTPPCTEGVRWSFLTEAVELAKEQIQSYADVIRESCCTFNNRPVQPLNGRELLLDLSED